MSLSAVVLILSVITAQAPLPGAPSVVAQPPYTPAPAPEASQALQLQVMLDRAGFSPGVIDGIMGSSTRKALDAYTSQHGVGSTGSIEPLTRYRITPEDAAGPFASDIPSDLLEQAKLPSLSYRSIVELLSERFHSSPKLLERLNPDAQFAAGDEIVVPNVEPLAPAAAAAPQQADTVGRAGQGEASARGTSGADRTAEIMARPDVVVTVSKSASALTVEDADGRVIFYAPVTTGSERDPLPIGEWKVNGVQLHPPFRYNPDLFWDADPSDSKATIPPGPNNPVGLVWIDLSKEHYGIHGTPEPSAIGRSASHGCVRLTNWDALEVAELVKPGTKVVFTR